MLNHYELTVKHIAPDGAVTVWPTSQVKRRDGSIEFPNRPDGMVVTVLTDGSVYVMNSHGKTVMNHDFGGPMAA